MKNKFFIGLIVVSAIVMLTGCAKVPQAELDAANAAIEEARVAEADIYVPGEYAALQDSMKVINEMIEAQKGKLFAKYSVAKEKLVALTSEAAVVKTSSVTKKAEVEAEIVALTTEVQAMVEQNKQLVAKAPRGKEGTAALEAIKSEIGVVETTAAEATALQQQGNLLGALDKLKAAKESATAINTELESVISKYAGKKR